MNRYTKQAIKYKVTLGLLLAFYVVLGTVAFLMDDEVLSQVFKSIMLVPSLYFFLSRRKHPTRKKPFAIAVFVSVMMSSLLYYYNDNVYYLLMNLGGIAFSVLTLLFFFKIYDRMEYSLG